MMSPDMANWAKKALFLLKTFQVKNAVIDWAIGRLVLLTNREAATALERARRAWREGLLGEAARWYDKAEAELRFGKRLRAEVLAGRAEVDLAAGIVADGIARCEQAGQLYAQLGDHRGQALAARIEGDLLVRKGHVEAGLARYKRAHLLYGEGDLSGRADIMLSEARVLSQTNQLISAQSKVTEARLLYRNAEDERGQARALLFEGILLEQRWESIKAAACFAQALAYAVRIQNELVRADVLRSWGELNINQGYLEQAAEQCDVAGDLYERCEQPPSRAHTLRLSGRLRMLRGQSKEAVAKFLQAMEVYTKLGESRNCAHVAYFLSEAYLYLGQTDEASAVCTHALHVYGEAEDSLGQANCQFRQAQIATIRGEYVRAERLCDAAMEIYTDCSDRMGQGEIELCRGEMLRQQTRYDEAGSNYRAALTHYKTVGNSERQVEALTSLVEVYLGLKQPDRATAAVDTAQRLVQDKGLSDRLAAVHVTRAMGVVAVADGRHCEAEKLLAAAVEGYKARRYPLGQTRALCHLADVQRAGGADDQADASLLGAREILVNLGAWGLVTQVDASLRH